MLTKNLLILIFCPWFIFGQYSKAEIDSLVSKEIVKLRKLSKYNDVVVLSEKVIGASKNINYKKGEAWGYARLGNALCTLGRHQESLQSLTKAKLLSESIVDNRLRAMIAVEIGRNYNESSISPTQAIEEFEEAIEFAKKIDKKYDRETYLLYAYQSLLSAYCNIQREDLAIPYLWKSLAIEEDAYSLAFITHYHVKNKNKDSIKLYLEKSTRFLKNLPGVILEKSIIDNEWGKYYEEEKQYDSAIHSYLSALQKAKQSQSTPEILKAVEGLSRCYEKKGDYKKTSEYLKIYSHTKDSISESNSKNVKSTINHIVKGTESGLTKQLSNLQKILFSVIALSFVTLILFGLKVIQQRNLQRKSKRLIEEKEILLNIKEEEKEQLKQKVNESFDDIVQLAKENSPEFLTRFQEVYPKLISNLLVKNPELLITELRFCAMLFLNFSTKDIAEYTFIATKTVQNKKNSIRKRLNISSEEDIYIWLKNLS